MPATTHHSIERVMERRSIKNVRTAEKNIARAIQNGKRAENFTSLEHTFLSKEGRDNCTAIAYNGFCYIVNKNGACVTVYPLPVWFGRRQHFRGKEPIRDFRKYCKSNRKYDVCKH